jgi:hypothetical protein
MNRSYIAARLEASRSGDFQSPFVKSGRFQIALPWFTSSPHQKSRLRFQNARDDRIELMGMT